MRFNGTMSDCRPMRQGLPQGSVLAPLLFIFYINALAEILPTNNLNSLFADDVEIFCGKYHSSASKRLTVGSFKRVRTLNMSVNLRSTSLAFSLEKLWQALRNSPALLFTTSASFFLVNQVHVFFIGNRQFWNSDRFWPINRHPFPGK